MNKINILIAEDHKLLRETMSFTLGADNRFKVVATCSTAEMAVELSSQLLPEVVIMDINLPVMDGFEATQLIRKMSPLSKILALSLYSQPSYAKRMFQHGAMGYVTKNSSSEEMIEAITTICEGKKYICQEVKNILTEHAIIGNRDKIGYHLLSNREIEIISFVKKGNSSKEIALSLGITSKTVEVHRYNILRKLNLKNSAALVNYINSASAGLN
jgi:DNA-binding NarL/FixJ family response regulator